MKLTQFLLLCLLATSATFVSSCGDDDDRTENQKVNDAIDGDWEVESWTIDGEEQFGFTVNSFDMEFTKQGPEDGETEWDIIFSNGNTSKIEGDYEIENNGTEVDVDGDDFDLDLDGDDLELTGNVLFNGVNTRWIITAERD